jgi:D-lactate dehydrogenase (cytochrome)
MSTMTTIARSDEGALREIETLMAGRCTRSAEMLRQHSHDESWHHPGLPDIVVFPTSTEDVARVVREASRLGLPIVAFGTGSSMEGHVNATRGGVCIDTRDMREILEVDTINAHCRVQAGVRRKELERHLRDTGYFFPVDPGADASLGGMAATRASGTTTVRYGSMRENVVGLTVVLADGRIIRTGGRAKKSSSGYDLTRLFVGSEGTLGVITELILRLSPIPEASTVFIASFPEFRSAVEAVHELLMLSLPLARIEYLDELEVDALNRFAGQQWTKQTTLILETHDTAELRDSIVEKVSDVLLGQGADVRIATTLDDQRAVWATRHRLADAERQLRPGCHMFVTDVAVPLSALAEFIDKVRRMSQTLGILAPAVGHIGDGNLHVTLLIDRDDPEEMRQAENFHDWIVSESLRLGGTATGEHGIGLGKRKYLVQEHGGAVEVMRAIKAALDPSNLMNPGKIFQD